jgi:hypothetical protein
MWKRQVVVLTPGQPIDVPIAIRAPSTVPLDLFILQDLTELFNQPMKQFNSTISQFLDDISNVVSDVWFGFASFQDKPIEPFGTYLPGFPGLMDSAGEVPVPLSADKQAIISIYNQKSAIDLSGGGDIPEAILEGMLMLQDVTGSVRNVGWRPATTSVVNRIVLVITDAPAHEEIDVANAIATGTLPNLGPIDSWNVNNNDPILEVGQRLVQNVPGESCPTSSLCLSLPGLLERYPNPQDVADIYSAKGIFPIFLVGPRY